MPILASCWSQDGPKYLKRISELERQIRLEDNRPVARRWIGKRPARQRLRLVKERRVEHTVRRSPVHNIQHIRTADHKREVVAAGCSRIQHDRCALPAQAAIAQAVVS